MKLISANWKCAKFLFLSAALFSFASSVQAIDKRWFASAEAGWATVADSYDEIHYNYSRWEFSHDINYSLSYGYQLDTFSVEGEYSYRRFDAERRIIPSDPPTFDDVKNLSGSQEQRSLLIMGYWYPVKNESVRPFFGIGAGYNRISWKNVKVVNAIDDGFTDSDTVFTYKVSTGFEIPLGQKSSFLLSYNYLKPDHVEVKDSIGGIGKLNKQEINIMDVGIKYYF